ncbi:hypothetical protein [Kitasatospora sp. GAS204B]|uniref:hypothetical protein n=1 Tax=unclassified Kitasatospora TaxID=2633591 RepID=UPI0024737176|nr:hypothetical protein [Kitasatospora sp. GAS204B]MDH6120645.1 hypothetical protein [Kitasatospora sp. GAS204B]
MPQSLAAVLLLTLTAAPRPTLADSGTSPSLLTVGALALTLLTLGTVALVRSHRR